MAITVSLVGSTTPQPVQIVVSATPVGEPWTVYGSTGDAEWTVPGGEGIGDGDQLTLSDNRAPLNVPVTYRFVAAATQTASPVTVVQATGDAVLQSLTGSAIAVVNLQDGSQEYSQEPQLALYTIPGRRRPVARHGVLGDPAGRLIARAPLTDTPLVDEVLASGAPVLCRMTGPTLDLPSVAILGITSVSSRGELVAGFREWNLSYVTLDDPYMDQRLGAFDWDYVDGVWAGDDWDDFDTFMTGRTWDEFDTLDWSTV